MMKMKQYSLLLLLSMILISCNDSTHAPDVSHIEVDINVQPFYQDLFAMDVNHLADDFPKLKNKYGSFVDAYSQRIISIGDLAAPSYFNYLKSFIEYEANQDVLKKCNEVYANNDRLDEELSQAYRYLKYYFPEQVTPEVYLHISGFNQSIVVDSSWISISIEKYLGADCQFYEWLSIPVYMRSKMVPEKVVPDVIKAVAMTSFQGKVLKEDVISQMIDEGKRLYFIQQMIPTLADSLLFDLSQQQLEWCKKHEADLWAGMVERKHLFNTERMVVQKYVGDSPFTYYFGQDSPGRAAIYIGYQIVQAFMDQSQDLSLRQLMHQNDAHKILRLSRYRP